MLTALPRSAGQLALHDGTSLSIRRVERDDRARVAALFDRLSPQSRYRRYLSPKPELTELELRRLTNIDHVRHEALAAVDDWDDSFIAMARYDEHPDRPEAAEMAVEVADELQQRGIGTTLARLIINEARRSGYAVLSARTLRENLPARCLLWRLDFYPRSSDGREIVFELALNPQLTRAAVANGPDVAGRPA